MGMFSTSPGVPPPIPGFRYPLHGAEVRSDRIQIGIDLNDLYSGWCAIEPSFAHQSGSGGSVEYGCVPEVTKIDHPQDAGCTLTLVDGTTQAMDCGRVSLCALEMACTCTATACSATLHYVTTSGWGRDYGCAGLAGLAARGRSPCGRF